MSVLEETWSWDGCALTSDAEDSPMCAGWFTMNNETDLPNINNTYDRQRDRLVACAPELYRALLRLSEVVAVGAHDEMLVANVAAAFVLRAARGEP